MRRCAARSRQPRSPRARLHRARAATPPLRCCTSARRSSSKDDDDDDDESMEGDRTPMDTSEGGGCASRAALRTLSSQLHALQWLPLVESTLSSMLRTHLKDTLHRRCAHRFDTPLIGAMLRWVDATVLPWLRVVLDPSSPVGEAGGEGCALPQALLQWQARLRFFFMQALASLRISELFDIVVDYPESLPALDDLRECLQHTHQHADVVASLGAAIEARLLKPGADTSNIIQVYVCTIRALRVLDSSGITLEAVSERVRSYLKARSDTVRQIVTALTDPESAEMLELAGGSTGQVLLQEDGGLDGMLDPDEARGDDSAVLNWTPDPATLLQSERPRTSSARRSSDVLAILVNIYGSKVLFVNEFRSMLSDKLLNAPGHDTEREVRNLELLKKRFGESALQSCEVMLHDVAESRRLTRSIHQHFGNVAATTGVPLVEATIVSRLCWPTLQNDEFELPAGVKKELKRFEKQFLHIKAPRKLVWKPTLGKVTIDVEFTDRTISDVICTPLQATILIRFAEQRRWELSALADELKIPLPMLRKKLALWVNRGYVQEVARTAGGATVYEAAASLGSTDARQPVDEEEEGGASNADAQAEQLAADMRVCEQYVMGMLTNIESLPLERIHNMLKMFLPANDNDRGYDRSEAELQRFLNSLVEDGKLDFSSSMYRIRKGS
uniref:Anaphase-promoting complex subunit 2 n=1 Tax=Calcidiscus leptoporus TaxID=127549 RepID=A0A7S0IYA2_9EUKA|mmetsp:Transcript_28001/g.65427  ORF Transcript_28001/g.65427 Transcript_28001/m.65427 type:complete len:673 (+) Transcript_28001:823-2841(+)